MLDHLSRGRLESASAAARPRTSCNISASIRMHAPAMYVEAYNVIRQALTQGEVNFNGKYYHFENVPIEMKPAQLPHPPFWYAVPVPEGAAWPAQNSDQHRLRRAGAASSRDHRSLSRRVGGGGEFAG